MYNTTKKHKISLQKLSSIQSEFHTIPRQYQRVCFGLTVSLGDLKESVIGAMELMGRGLKREVMRREWEELS